MAEGRHLFANRDVAVSVDHRVVESGPVGEAALFSPERIQHDLKLFPLIALEVVRVPGLHPVQELLDRVDIVAEVGFLRFDSALKVLSGTPKVLNELPLTMDILLGTPASTRPSINMSMDSRFSRMIGWR